MFSQRWHSRQSLVTGERSEVNYRKWPDKNCQGDCLACQLSISRVILWLFYRAVPAHLKHMYRHPGMLKLPPGRQPEHEQETRGSPFKNNAGHLK